MIIFGITVFVVVELSWIINKKQKIKKIINIIIKESYEDNRQL